MSKNVCLSKILSGSVCGRSRSKLPDRIFLVCYKMGFSSNNPKLAVKGILLENPAWIRRYRKAKKNQVSSSMLKVT